jgi:serine/threonine-protein kinase RsbW
MAKTIARLQITAHLDELLQVRQFVEETAVSFTNDPQVISDIVLAVDEAVTNIIRHGYQLQVGTIEITISYQSNRLEIRLRDEAPAFDPTQMDPPDQNIPLSQRKPGGLGVFMMRQLTDDLQYQPLADGRNELLLVKQIDS